jgi:hypothetical protein
VWVTFPVCEGMVLSMDSDPLARPDAREHPNQHAEDKVCWGSQGQRAVRQRSVQVHRRNHEGNLGDEQPDEDGPDDGQHGAQPSARCSAGGARRSFDPHPLRRAQWRWPLTGT